MKRSEATNIVLYDDQCPLCVSQMRILRRLDLFNAFRFQKISDPQSSEFISNLKREDLLAAIHCVTEDGIVFRAARCFRFLAMRIPVLVPLALLLWIPGIIWIAERIYIRVARSRSKFFGCKESCARKI